VHALAAAIHPGSSPPPARGLRSIAEGRTGR